MKKKLEDLEFRVLQVNDDFYPQWKKKEKKKWESIYWYGYDGKYKDSYGSLNEACQKIEREKLEIKPVIKVHDA